MRDETPMAPAAAGDVDTAGLGTDEHEPARTDTDRARYKPNRHERRRAEALKRKQSGQKLRRGGRK